MSTCTPAATQDHAARQLTDTAVDCFDCLGPSIETLQKVMLIQSEQPMHECVKCFEQRMHQLVKRVDTLL